jgi:hypothetical protein
MAGTKLNAAIRWRRIYQTVFYALRLDDGSDKRSVVAD